MGASDQEFPALRPTDMMGAIQQIARDMANVKTSVARLEERFAPHVGKMEDIEKELDALKEKVTTMRVQFSTVVAVIGIALPIIYKLLHIV